MEGIVNKDVLGQSRTWFIIWFTLMWVGLIGEGLWFFVAFGLAGFPGSKRLIALLALWLLLVVSALFFRKKPVLTIGAAWMNLIGCITIKSFPGAVNHAWAWLIYGHSVDAAIVVCAHLAALKLRNQITVGTS
jgi:hypothetical protein